jgi:hypothetical protein
MSPTLRHKVDHLTCFVPGMLALGAVNAAGLDFVATGNTFMQRRLSGELHTQVMAALEKEASEMQQRLATSQTPEPQPDPKEATCSDDGCEVNIGSTSSRSEDAVNKQQQKDVPPTPPTAVKAPPNMFSVIKDIDTAIAASTSKLIVWCLYCDRITVLLWLLPVVESVIDTFLQPLEIRGVVELVKEDMNRMLGIAANLTHTCYQMYAQTKSGERFVVSGC